MDWKKIGKALLFPPIAVVLFLLPAAGGALAYSFCCLEETNPIRIAAYVLSFYTLTVWCVRMPELLRALLSFKNENPYARIWLGDIRFRVNVTLTGNVLWNGAYAALQLGLGLYHRSFWFFSLAVYYWILAILRLFLVCHTVRYRPGEKMRQELRIYRSCGWVLLLLNGALSVMTFLMIAENRTVKHHEITTIAMATYTFASLTAAIVNVFRYRRYQSPVLSASRAISLAAACVSMLTLEGTMLATFGGASMKPETQRLFLGATGGAITLFVAAMALSVMVKGKQWMEDENGTKRNLSDDLLCPAAGGNSGHPEKIHGPGGG